MLLTAQRGGEVLGMRWTEVDFSEKCWTIPEERSKNGLSHPRASIPGGSRRPREAASSQGRIRLGLPEPEGSRPARRNPKGDPARSASRRNRPSRPRPPPNRGVEHGLDGNPAPRHRPDPEPRRDRRHRCLRPSFLRPGKAGGPRRVGTTSHGNRKRIPHRRSRAATMNSSSSSRFAGSEGSRLPPRQFEEARFSGCFILMTRKFGALSAGAALISLKCG